MNIVIVRSERYTVKLLDLSGKDTTLQSGMNCLKYRLLLEQDVYKRQSERISRKYDTGVILVVADRSKFKRNITGNLIDFQYFMKFLQIRCV